MTTEKKTRAEEMMSMVNAASLDEAKDFINEFKDVVLQDEARVKVPENVFREIFLPYFTGEVKASEDNNYLAHWSGIVESPTAWADVVNVKGEVLFEVPPLIDTSSLNTSRQGPQYAGLLTEFSETGKIHPGLAWPSFAEGAAERIDGLFKDVPENPPTVKAWQNIYAFYGLTDKPQDETAQKAKPAAEDDFEL